MKIDIQNLVVEIKDSKKCQKIRIDFCIILVNLRGIVNVFLYNTVKWFVYIVEIRLNIFNRTV